MKKDFISRDSDETKVFYKTLDEILNQINAIIKNNKPALNGERYLTDREVSDVLKISRRTLQEYRTTGVISYYQLGGKVLYRESDIQKLLDDNYRKKFR